MLPSLTQITSFNAACRERNITEAAEALGVTQSAVTQNIAKFEQIIGATLFERRKKGLFLTPTGSKIYAITKEIGFLSTILEESIENLAKLDHGTLRIAAASANPAMLYLKRFKTSYPEVGIIFESANWRKCAQLLKSRDFDIAIMPEPEDPEGFYYQHVQERKHLVYVYNGHPLANKEEIELADLVNETMIFSSNRSFTRWRVENVAEKLDYHFKDIMNVSTTPMTLEAVRNKLGIAIACDQEASGPNDLRCIPLRQLKEPYKVCAVCLESRSNLHMIQRFYDCIS